jgi:hypothetical protein
MNESPFLNCMWFPGVMAADDDYHVAFRGVIELPADLEVEIRLLGASWYNAWLDGAWLAEGPPRFPPTHPEHQVFRIRPGAGRHLLAVQVHAEGAETRIVGNIPPFLWCEVLSGGAAIPVRWSCARLEGYAGKVRRINALLGWIDWCDTRANPAGWQLPGFDDSRWAAPAQARLPIAPPVPLSSADTRRTFLPVRAIAGGNLVEMFGYERDNPAARFFLRDLAPDALPPQGVWRRYDLGRVRLSRPVFELELPAGAVVEFSYCEALQHGRVCPWISLSTSDSCNLDHFVARGGLQEFSTHGPRGGRFVEVHVIAPPDQVRFVGEQFVDRGYYGASEGAFACDDALLNRIWETGVETHRACAEDALTDTPTRERGQWAGDIVMVGMEIAGVAFGDLRLCRRGLHQCAQSARADGLVAGMCPGQDIYLSTYAAQWVSACVHYWELTGDRGILQELFGAAERNLASFAAHCGPEGLGDGIGWPFVDWGYIKNPGPSDMAVNLHYLAALRDMVRWCDTVGRADRAAHYADLGRAMEGVIRAYYDAERGGGEGFWERIGYHRAILGLKLGFFTGDDVPACVAQVKAHILRCFPNDPTAPRLSDPAANNSRLITPYFAHFAMPELIDRGEMDFVLDQYRKCWGWALEGGRTTWIEVFDTRWTHCHQWAGCPTWQLSRYALGLRPAFELGERHYRFVLNPGSLRRASGRVPVPGRTDAVSVSWERTASGVRYKVDTPVPIVLHLGTGRPEPVEVSGRFEREISLPGVDRSVPGSVVPGKR